MTHRQVPASEDGSLESKVQSTVSKSERGFFKNISLWTTGLFLAGMAIFPDTSYQNPSKVSRALDQTVEAASLGASAAKGYAFDVYTGSPIESVLVTLDGNQMMTGPSGYFIVGGPTGVPNPQVPDAIPLTKPKQNNWFGCSNNNVSGPEEEPSAAAKIGVQNSTSYQPGFIYFEKPNTHWGASHDLTQETGIVDLNASLPKNISPRYGLSLTPEQYRDIWGVFDDPVNGRWVTYRTEDLPIPVDGEITSAADSIILQTHVNTINDAIGTEFYRLVPGNGLPNMQTGKKGIYFYHVGQVASFTVNIPNSDETYEYMLGAIVRVREDDFDDPGFQVVDKEGGYRSMNQGTWLYSDGIFDASPQPLTSFNEEHLQLQRKLKSSSESVQGQPPKNNLIAYDYVRHLY
jgi:hypothetical protein